MEAEITWAQRLDPRAPVRVQLVAAASVWAIGAAILLVRGVGYISGRYWHSWLLAGAATALLLGWAKARFLLDRVATKAVARIRDRGTACFFGFFSPRAWFLVALMMGAGMTLRRLVVHPGVIGAGILGAVYVGIGTALVIADRIFWRAAFARESQD